MADKRRFAPYFRVVKVTTPAVGAEWTFTPDRAAGVLVRSVLFQLATSAVAATRVPALRQTDGSDQYARHLPGNGQTASGTFLYSGNAGNSMLITAGSNVSFQLPTDGIWLQQGHILSSSTDNRDAGDQFSAIVLGIYEFPTGSPFTFVPLVPVFELSSE
jgi:hypothetical protein